MNGIENITRRISDDARRRAESVLAQAKREAETAASGFAETAAAECAAITERGRAQAAERELRLNGVSELEAKKKSLAAKQEMIDRAFSAAAEKLRGLPDDEYTSLLARLAVRAAAGSAGEIILGKDDRARIGAAVLAAATAENPSLTLAEDTREFNGGLVLRAGTMETNCTFDALIGGLREEMAADVAKILFA